MVSSSLHRRASLQGDNAGTEAVVLGMEIDFDQCFGEGVAQANLNQWSTPTTSWEFVISLSHT